MHLIKQALGAASAALGLAAVVALAVTINLTITGDLNLPDVSPTTWW